MTIEERHAKLLFALRSIAGVGPKPLPGEAARQIARRTLVALGERWPKQVQFFKVETVDGQAKLIPMAGKAA